MAGLNDVDKIYLARYFRAISESEAAHAFNQAIVNLQNIRVEGNRVFAISRPGHEHLICKCYDDADAAQVARLLKEREAFSQVINQLTGELSEVLRSLAAAVLHFINSEQFDGAEWQLINAMKDRLEVVCEYGDDLFQEIIEPFVHPGKFKVAHAVQYRDRSRTKRLLGVVEKVEQTAEIDALAKSFPHEAELLSELIAASKLEPPRPPEDLG